MAEKKREKRPPKKLSKKATARPANASGGDWWTSTEELAAAALADLAFRPARDGAPGYSALRGALLADKTIPDAARERCDSLLAQPADVRHIDGRHLSDLGAELVQFLRFVSKRGNSV